MGRGKGQLTYGTIGFRVERVQKIWQKASIPADVIFE